MSLHQHRQLLQQHLLPRKDASAKLASCLKGLGSAAWRDAELETVSTDSGYLTSMGSTGRWESPFESSESSSGGEGNGILPQAAPAKGHGAAKGKVSGAGGPVYVDLRACSSLAGAGPWCASACTGTAAQEPAHVDPAKDLQTIRAVIQSLEKRQEESLQKLGRMVRESLAARLLSAATAAATLTSLEATLAAGGLGSVPGHWGGLGSAPVQQLPACPAMPLPPPGGGAPPALKVAPVSLPSSPGEGAQLARAAFDKKAGRGGAAGVKESARKQGAKAHSHPQPVPCAADGATMRENLQDLQAGDLRCVLAVRRINHLGFDSANTLRAHFAAYGRVRSVRVVHSKQCKESPKEVYVRLRPAALGFVVMENVQDAAAALRAGEWQKTVSGAAISVRPFELPRSGAAGLDAGKEDHSCFEEGVSAAGVGCT